MCLSSKVFLFIWSLCSLQFPVVLLSNTTVLLSNTTEQQSVLKQPSVLISIIARNEEQTLPTFFAYIDVLNYPKDRISILIQTDHNEDKTAKIITEWVSKTKRFYHKVLVRHEAYPESYKDAFGPNEYTLSRYMRLLDNRQIALDEAREQWADYLFQVNAGNLLVYPDVLNDLISCNKSVIAPMLVLFDPKSGYSNFWAGIDERGYYKRVPKYYEILKRNVTGTFEVPMIHSTILFNMQDKRLDKLKYFPIPDEYDGETDDILISAWTVRQAGLKMHISNKNEYGYIIGLYSGEMTLKQRHQGFTDIFIDHVAFNPPLPRSEYINHTFPVATKKGFDEVFMINLVRRPDRRIKMEIMLKELGLDYKYFPAVDGKNLTQEDLTRMGIKAMPDFKDPYLERPLTFGEIGCFLSHWNIWLEMIDRKLEMVLVLEDDVRFEPDFNKKVDNVMTEARNLLANGVEWDILYFGRKPLVTHIPEKMVLGCTKIVWAKYSYWTLGYVLRLSGAKQLVDGNPFHQMIPVDEYIPIKFNECGDEELLHKFLPRDMIGFSAGPLILFPTHYVGDTGYISDTEDTLSFEGKDVTIFREIKEKEKEMEQEKEKEKKEKEKKEAEGGDDKSKDISEKVEGNMNLVNSGLGETTVKNQVNHGEL